MSDVDVQADGDERFVVVVRDGGSATRHAVTMDAATFARLAAGAAVSRIEIIRAVFAFLLEREPKESILARFDVTVVSRYFPEFERELGRYLTR